MLCTQHDGGLVNLLILPHDVRRAWHTCWKQGGKPETHRDQIHWF